MGDSGKVDLDLNLPPPSPDKVCLAESSLGHDPVPVATQTGSIEPTSVDEQGGGGVRVAKVRPRKLVRLGTIRKDGGDEDEKPAGVESSSAPAASTPTLTRQSSDKQKVAVAQVKDEKLGKKRGRQTVRLEIDESLQIARPPKVQTTSRPQMPPPPPPLPPAQRRERESFESSEHKEFTEPPREKERELREVKPPQYHRPNVRRNSQNGAEEQQYQRPKRQGSSKRGGYSQTADASIEKLHREATCRKLWQDPNLDTELQRVPGSFASLEEYVQVFEPLLFEECRAQLYSVWEEIGESGKDLHMPAYVKFVEKRDRGWYDITICPAEARMRFSFKEGDVAVLSTSRLDPKRRSRTKEGDADEVKEDGEVSVKIAGIIRRYVPLDVREALGAVLFVNFSEEDFGYPSQVLEDLRQGVRWSLTILGGLATTQREYIALHGLHRLQSQEMISAILQPRPELFPRYDQEQAGLASFTPAFLQHLRTNFNPPQLSAIHWAAMHTAAGTVAAGQKQEIWPFSLVQGPPGTGKTHTVWGMLNAIHLVQYQRYYEALMRQIAPTPEAAGEEEQGGFIDEVLQKMDRSLTRTLPKLCPKPRMLVCAPSNAATDELLSRVIDREFMDGEMRKYRPDIVRVGTDPQTKAALTVSVEKRTEHLLTMNKDEVVPWIQSMRAREIALMQHIAIVKMDLAASHVQGTVGVEPEVLAARDQARDFKQRQLASLMEERDKVLVDISRAVIVESLLRPGSGVSIEEARTKLEASYANEAEIVFTTLSSSGRKLFMNLTRGFDIIVIDEAAQASELGVLPPLILGTTRCVLVGDPQQLPATVISRVADTMQYSRSLFERFQQAGCPTLMLTVQYRMHPQIRDFPSRHFYQGRLQDSECVKNLPDEVYHHDPLLPPFMFFDVSHGKESHISGSVSLQNSIEAKFAARLFEHLQQVLKAAGKHSTVGVISPYKLQLKCIQKEFDSIDAKGVYINTVDAFQGQERDVIIMSCVRASNHGVGFVADIRRMNVALTRARRSLWVIGNASTLLQSEDWAALIKDAKARKCFMTYSAAVEKGLVADGFLSKVLRDPKKEQQLRIGGGGGGEPRRDREFRGRRGPGPRLEENNGEKKTAESYLRQHNSMRKS